MVEGQPVVWSETVLADCKAVFARRITFVLPPAVLGKLLAEDISEVPGGLCWCGCKATMNARVNGAGQVIKVGEQVLIDNQQSIRYIGLCYKHWKMGKAYA